MWAFPPAAGSTMRAQSTGPSGQQSRGSVAYYTRLCLEAIASISINCLQKKLFFIGGAELWQPGTGMPK